MIDRDSTAEINPYALPSVPDPVARPDPSVGVWRDGNLFITHRDAALPPICVKSGLPAAEWIALPVNYYDLATLTRVTYTLRAPLSARSMWWRRVGPRISLGVAAVAFGCVPFLFSTEALDNPPYRSLLLAIVVVGLIAMLSALTYWRILDYHRCERNYFWFAGAHRKFLTQLPPWPGL